MSRRKLLVQRLLPALVSVGALTWLLSSIELSALARALSWSVVAVLVPMLAFYGIATLLLEAAAIVLLMSSRPRGFGLWTAARIKSASYLLGIVNYALGAGALTVLLRRRAGIGLGESASIVLLITSVDTLILMIMAGAGTTLMDTGAPAVRAGLFALLIIGFVIGMIVLRMPANLGPIERLRSLTVFEALRTTPLARLAKLAVLRVLFVSSFIALGGAAFVGFGISIPISDLIVGMVVVGVVSALPIAVAGLGTGQIAVVEAFGHIADRETLLALSLVLTAGMLTLRAGMGLLMAREFTREVLEETRAAEALGTPPSRGSACTQGTRASPSIWPGTGRPTRSRRSARAAGACSTSDVARATGPHCWRRPGAGSSASIASFPTRPVAATARVSCWAT